MAGTSAATPPPIMESQVRAARDRLIATYSDALARSHPPRSIERVVLTSAVAANSAMAARELTGRWSGEMAEPMERLAEEVRREDVLGRSMSPGGTVLLALLGPAKVLLCLLLALIAWLLRVAALPQAAQVGISVFILAAVLYVLGGPILTDERTEELDRGIRGRLDPDQRELFRLLGGAPPVTEPARLIRANLTAARRLLIIGFLALILSPLLASLIGYLRSSVGMGS